MKYEIKIKEKISNNTEIIGSIFVTKELIKTEKGLKAKVKSVGHNLEFKFFEPAKGGLL